MEEPATQLPPRRRVGWIIGGAAALAALGTMAFWFLMGPKFWTDGGAIRVSDRGTNVRQVVWTHPQPLEGFSSDEQVYEPALSPDGTELYFVRGKAGKNAKIYLSLRRNNAWTAPAAVDAVNGPFDSLGPRVSPNGNYLLFYSNRPGGFGGYGIWVAPRNDKGGGEPFNLGPEVNSEFNEFNPDPTPDGRRLIFATNRMAAKREQNEAWRSTIRETVSSDYDLWIADSSAPAEPGLPTEPGRPATQPATLPVRSLSYRHAREIPGVNTPFTEGASCMSPAGDFLYFASNRPGGLGKFDIYRCRVQGDEFGPVENVGLPINSTENEADPALAFNGFRMFFSSDRPGAEGRYYLLASDSREVYPQRQTRPLPHLGWSWWVLIISLLALIPLLLMMRGWEDQRFSMIQKCLLLSLLVHALITFLLSFIAVTQKVTQYVRQEMQMEVAVNLGDSRGVEETLAVRSQMSGELPVSSVAPPSMAPVKVESVAEQAPAAMAMDVPVLRSAPGGMTLAVPMPRIGAPAFREIATATLAPSTAIDATIDIARAALTRVAQSEATPQPGAAQQAGQRQVRPDDDAAAAAQHAAEKTDIAPSTATAARTSTVAAESARLWSNIAGGIEGQTAAPSIATASANGPEPAADGLLPRVAKTTGSEPALAFSRQGPSTRAAQNSAIAGQPRPKQVELAAAAQITPTTMPSAALAAAASNRPAKNVSIVRTDTIPRAQSTFTSQTQIDARPTMADAAQTKLVGTRPEQPVAHDAPATATPLGIREAAGAPGMVQLADAKRTTPSSGDSNVSSAPLNPLTAVGSVRGSSDAVRPSTAAGTVADPEISGPAVVASAGVHKAAGAEAALSAAAPPGQSSHRIEGPVQIGAPRSIEITSAPMVALSKSPAGGHDGPGMGGLPTARAQLASAEIKPTVSLSTLSGPLGPGKSLVPDLQFIRAPEQRQPMLEQFGGTRESEDAVSRGLAYLARVQEPDGHWTRIEDDQPRRRGRGRGSHDMACTGFAVLAFLGRDETPDRPGPYREAVAKAVDYLIAQQGDDGDLRGAQRFRGGGSDSANMYDHGIATYALAECAIMTRDPRATEAAIKGARFIVSAQNDESGGWRYSPNEYGDSSVFGWQIMALHSAEQVGFEVPAETLENAKRYIASCGEGRYRHLAGYQPHTGPTPPMTAELLFSRMLLGVPLKDEGIEEATRYLARQPPEMQNADLYYWYYASLSMLHMQNPLWKDWNVLTRESLIHMQETDGPSAGSWATNLKWGDRGGRVFTTALATLTLEVYYRYLPMRKAAETPSAQPQH